MTGIETIPLRIPENWDPKWFEVFVREVLALADIRNAEGVGISISGTSDITATLTGASGDASFVVISANPNLDNERILAVEAGVLTLTDNGANATVEIGVNIITIVKGGTGATTAAGARTNLDVDQAGTDNSTDVTLAGTPDYLTIAGQIITLGLIDLTTDVSGDLPVTEGGTGSSSAGGARTNLGLVIGTNVQAWDADLDILAANGLTAVEFQQLQNINTTTISIAQWGFIGGADQAVKTTDTPTFSTANVGVGGYLVSSIKVVGAQEAAIASLTNSTGGSATGDLVSIGDTSTSNEGSKINDNFTELNTKVDAILAILRPTGHGLIAT